MKKLKVLLTIVISSIIMITGCTNIENNINNNDTDLVENSDNNENKNSSDIEINTEINNKYDILESDSENENININTEISDKESSNIKEINLDITSLDANSGEEIVVGSLMLYENQSIEEKVNALIKQISKVSFNNAPIVLEKIENNIAYIDLKEGVNTKDWSEKYFQGSTGGSITTYTLTENILQRSYNGEWISGVYFSYEGKTDMEFDHIDMDFFGNIINR